MQDQALREEANVKKCIDAMEQHLNMWSTRRLTLVGRILILKTYAISQQIFLMQTMSLKHANIIKLTRVCFKFL